MIKRLASRNKGFTLVEVLTVVVVVSSLLASVASVFILTLRSYSEEYELEAVENQAQRAAVELDYFARRATGAEVSPSGDMLDLTQPKSFSTLKGTGKVLGVVRFKFDRGGAAPTTYKRSGAVVLPPGYSRASLTIQGWTPEAAERGDPVPDVLDYTYSGDFVVDSTGIFAVSPEGALSYRWELLSQGGLVPVSGFLPLR